MINISLKQHFLCTDRRRSSQLGGVECQLIRRDVRGHLYAIDRRRNVELKYRLLAALDQRRPDGLAVGETVILLHPPLPLVGLVLQ